MTKKQKLYQFFFDIETKSGKRFDILINIMIILSILAVMLESVQSIQQKFGLYLHIFEWIVTVFFTAEYIARLKLEEDKINYAFSLFGIIDLLTIIPSYLSLFITGTQGFMVVRAMRLLRVFRVLKLNRNSQQGKLIVEAMKASKDKIIIFLYSILMIITVIGTLIYLVEGHKPGFENIPQSIYWALRKLTIMESDFHPITNSGIAIESFVKLLAHIVLAIPTGIITASILNSLNKSSNLLICEDCKNQNHDKDAVFCKVCGGKIISKINFNNKTDNKDNNLMVNVNSYEVIDR